MAEAGGSRFGLAELLRRSARLAMLLGLGFGAGLLIGIVSSEPQLLLGHVRGESETMLLAPRPADPSGDRGEAFSDAVIADAREAGGAAADEEVEVVAGLDSNESAASPADRPAVSAPAAARTGTTGGGQSAAVGAANAGTWAIQVGAFSGREAADRLAEDLSRKGYPVEVVSGESASQRWRVRVQPVEGEARARGTAERLKQQERLPTWVLRMEARAGR